MDADARTDHALVPLAASGLTVADPAQDVRGRAVVGRDGEELGHVSALLLDEEEAKIRFLEVESGGFLGLGADRRLLPVDSVARVDDDAVHVDPDGGRAGYDPELGEAPPHVADLYGLDGVRSTGFLYPPFPH